VLRSPSDRLWRKHPHFPRLAAFFPGLGVVVLGDLHMSVNAEKMFTQHNCLAEGEWRGKWALRGGEGHNAQHGASAAPMH